MRYFLPLILSLSLLGTGPVLAQVKTEVSEITGAERLVSKSMQNLVSESYPGHGSFRAEYEKPPENDPIWRLTLFGFAKAETPMTTASDVRIQVDGPKIRRMHGESKTISPRRIESRTRQLEDSILEIKEAIFTRDDFETIATAENVSAVVGSFSFELTYPLRKDLRLILDRVPEGERPQTASSDDSDSSQ